MVRIINEAADLADSIRRTLESVGNEDAFPNYADLSVPLPAGHWRALLPIITELAAKVDAEATGGDDER